MAVVISNTQSPEFDTWLPDIHAMETELDNLHKQYPLTYMDMNHPNPNVDEYRTHLEEFFYLYNGRISLIYEEDVAAAIIAYDTSGRISTLYVREQFRRKGYGKILVETAASLIDKPISLTVAPQNKEAIAFYQCLGFAEAAMFMTRI